MRKDAALPNSVVVREVCPRDGFQNVKEFIPTERKLEWIDTLFEAGVVEMEVTSFVSPKAIPQLADAADVLEETKRRHPTARLTALVPNAKGAERALACGADVTTRLGREDRHHGVFRKVHRVFQRLDRR